MIVFVLHLWPIVLSGELDDKFDEIFEFETHTDSDVKVKHTFNADQLLQFIVNKVEEKLSPYKVRQFSWINFFQSYFWVLLPKIRKDIF